MGTFCKCGEFLISYVPLSFSFPFSGLCCRPTNTASKIVTILYFPVGIILVVMLIALIRVTALASINERFVRGLQAANRRRKEVIMKRRVEATARRGEIVPAEQDEIPTEDVGEDVDELRTSEDQESYEKMLKDAAYKHHNTYAAEVR
jgi:hypothetical protein